MQMHPAFVFRTMRQVKDLSAFCEIQKPRHDSVSFVYRPLSWYGSTMSIPPPL
jgi:hypothetical protein